MFATLHLLLSAAFKKTYVRNSTVMSYMYIKSSKPMISTVKVYQKLVSFQ